MMMEMLYDFDNFPIDLYSTESFPVWEREYNDQERIYRYVAYRTDRHVRLSYGLVDCGSVYHWCVRVSRAIGADPEGMEAYRIIAIRYQLNCVHPSFALTDLARIYAA